MTKRNPFRYFKTSPEIIRLGGDAVCPVPSLARECRVTVVCSPKDRDRYGRTVATCEAREIDVGRWMVLQGWALDYERYSKGEYAGAQAAAKSAKRGLWVGVFEPPWEWRRR